MKRLLYLLSLFLIVSCSKNPIALDPIYPIDYTLPKLEDDTSYEKLIQKIARYRQCDYYGIPNEEILNSVIRWTTVYDIQKEIVLGLITTESHFDIYAVSPVDCRGLTQLCRDTVLWFNSVNDTDYTFEDAFDFDINIQISCWYLRRLYDYSEILGIDKTDILAAYNLGYRYVGIKPTTYPDKVLDYAIGYLD